MAKRQAKKQLTMENYEQDDEDDCVETDAGPRLASQEVCKNRQIARAKRRSDLNLSQGEPKKAFTGFAGFKGFGSTSLQTSSMTSSPFKAVTSTPLSTQTNGSKADTEKSEPTTTSAADEDSEDQYNKRLSQLNRSFFKHISGYMSRSEYYDFTEVCKEYIDYHKKIESEANDKSAATALPSQTSDTSTKTTNASDNDSSMFAKPSLQFNLNAIQPIGDSTASTLASREQSEDVHNEDENDEPPKVESVEHKESDSVFTKKCKLFFKRGEEWSSKGVGYLFIKKETPSSTAQLLIRADNKLGTILLHICLNDSIPVSKAPQNKGVFVSCVPNPPLDPKASTQENVTFLIRVNANDIEGLFDSLVKYKSNQ